MGFKLGKKRAPAGNKLFFGADKDIIPGVPVIRKKMGEGILGEANDDGSIFICPSIPEGSRQEQITLMHELRHNVDMKTGKLSYADDHIGWDGERYERADGHILFEGEWVEEGSDKFPWEGH